MSDDVSCRHGASLTRMLARSCLRVPLSWGSFGMELIEKSRGRRGGAGFKLALVRDWRHWMALFGLVGGGGVRGW
jgi:hypothetical protein